MAQLKDFSKIIHSGNELGKVLHLGKTIWQKEPDEQEETDVYLAKDSDFVEVYGDWIYKGTELEVEIPTHINGELVTSTYGMFSSGLFGEDSGYDATPVTKVVLNHSNVTEMSYMFAGSQAPTLDLSSFDTSNVTDMSGMFNGSSATTLDLSSFNTSNVTNMSSMFFSSKATTLDLSNFDTSSVTDMDYMFQNSSTTIGYARTQADADKLNSSSLKPAGLNFVVKPSTDVYLAQDSDFVKVEGYWVYRGSELEIKIPSTIQGKSITSYRNMFSGISTYDATPVTRVVSDNPNVTTMYYMFRGSQATTLDLSSFDTSNVTNTTGMFRDSAATTLDLSSFDTSNVTNTSSMFRDSAVTVGYARTQADADKFNASSYKPTGLNFVVKP